MKKRNRFLLLLTILILCLTRMPSLAQADYLDNQRMYFNPESIKPDYYKRINLNDLSSQNEYTWPGGNDPIMDCDILPVLREGTYPAGYFFTENDYLMIPNQDYFADLDPKTGDLTVIIYRSGIYQVRITHKSFNRQIYTIMAEAGLLEEQGKPDKLGATQKIPSPKGDLILVEKPESPDSTLDQAAENIEKDGGNVQRTSSVEDAINKIRAASKEMGRKIHVELVGHGSPGNISVGDGTGWEEGKHLFDSEDAVKKFQEAIDDYVSGISIFSCSSAAGEDGAKLLKTLASSIGWASGYTVPISVEKGYFNKELRGLEEKVIPEQLSNVSIDLTNVSAEPGDEISIPILFSSRGYPVGGISLDIHFDPKLFFEPWAQINTAIGPGTETDRMLISSLPAPGLFRIGIIPNYNHKDSMGKTIPDGMLATLYIYVSQNIPVNTKLFLDNDPSSSTPAGRPLPTLGKDGIVSIHMLDQDLDNDGFTAREGDCDDLNYKVYPDAPEIFDGLDNDCDGFVDEEIGPLPKEVKEIIEMIEAMLNDPTIKDGTLILPVSLVNKSENTYNPPLIIVVDSRVPVLNPDGKWIDGAPYFDYSKMLSSLVLKPGETVGPKEMIFEATSMSEVQPDFRVYARLGRTGWVPILKLPEIKQPLEPQPLRLPTKNLTRRVFQFEALAPGLNVRMIQREEKVFHEFSIPGGNLLGEQGEPGLPGFTRLVAVPHGAQMLVEVIEGEPEYFEGYLIHPIQEIFEDNEEYQPKPFQINEDAYKKGRYPESLISIEYDMIRDCRIAILNVHAARYNPTEMLLEYYPELEVNITFEGGDEDIYIPPEKQSRFFEEVYIESIANYEVARANIHDLVYRGPFFTFLDLLIITPTAFKTQADELADWKKDKGFLTKVATLDDINTAQGGTTANDIRNYIINTYNNRHISYVLLMGDAEFIPPHYVTPHPTAHAGTLMGTDLYYAEMDGTGYFPDIAIGRIPVDTASEAQSVVDKIINYEENPTNNTNFYRTILHAGFFQDDDRDGWVEASDSDGRAEREFAETMEEIRDFFISEGYPSLPREYTTDSPGPMYWRDGTTIPSYLQMPTFQWSGSTAGIINQINSGTFLVPHRDHGGFSGWGDPDFHSGDLSGLTNTDLYPVVLSINCQTGWFDNETDDATLGTSYYTESFAENLLKLDDAGAVTVIAATRNSPSWPNNDLTEAFIDCIWNDMLPSYPGGTDVDALALEGSRRMGDALNYAKFYVASKWTGVSSCQRMFEIYHVLGDPTLEIWTSNPNLFPYYPFEPLELQREIIVLPIEDEKLIVSLIQEGEIIAQGIPQNGQVSLQLKDPLTYSDDTYITLNKGGYVPRIVPVELVGEGICYVDGDGDGFGDPEQGVQSTTPCPQGYSDPNHLDCNDKDETVYPEAPELCDGKDNDCDGSVDEALTRVCETECGEGTETCYRGTWVCDAQEPETEVCDGEDNDCDGSIDEEDAKGCMIFYKDGDQDSYGVDADRRCLCEPDEEGRYTATRGGDTDDQNPGVPGTISESCIFNATILATGLDLGVDYINEADVVIGIEEMDETIPLPPPPLKPYTVSMAIKDLSASILTSYYGDIRMSGSVYEKWLLKLIIPDEIKEAYPETYHPLLSWEPDEFCFNGYFRLWTSNADGDLNALLVGDMTDTNRYQMTENDSDYICIVWSQDVVVDMTLPSGWSMISLPLIPADSTLSTLFSDAVAVFRFTTKYELVAPHESLEPGEGYWIYLSLPNTYTITGSPFESFTLTNAPPGWSMIGSCSYPSRAFINTGTIRAIFGFDNKYELIGSGNHVGPMPSGKGFWINLSEMADLTVEKE